MCLGTEGDTWVCACRGVLPSRKWLEGERERERVDCGNESVIDEKVYVCCGEGSKGSFFLKMT